MKIGSRSLDRYVLVGLFNSALDVALFSLLALAVGLAPVVSNVVSTVVVMTVSFFLNRAWVFRSETSGVGTYLRFVAVTLFTGLLVQSLVILGVIAVSAELIPALPDAVVTPGAKIAAMAVGMVVNFLGYRWLFSHRRVASPPAPEQAGDRRSPSGG
ncbi:GtrA family protein [Nocardioides gilvus]|uniref:GtrA family protein n=1 Tax=Nocardioides gilvus TaxID=1735589 RepID=UPI000D745124|nr:GtrA family protein [Nocardioides gilvus]